MRRVLPVLLLLLLWVAVPCFAQEVQVPLDERGTVTVVDPALARSLGLFAEYRGFREARLFRLAQDRFVLEVLYQPDDQVVRDRRELTAEEVAALRQRVANGLASRESREVLDQGGRTKLLIGSTALSFLFYGPAVPVTLDVQDGSVATALYLLTSSAGFFVPYLLTRDRSVPEAATSLALHGGTRGILHGVFFAMLLSGDDLSEEGVFGSGFVFGLTEGILGYRLARETGMTAGGAEVLGFGGDLGLLFGLGSAVLIAEEDASSQLIAGLALAGAGAGHYAGWLGARTGAYTRGDARTLRALTAVGSFAGLALGDLTGSESGRVRVGITMAGTAGALLLSRSLLRGQDFTPAQGTFIQLGTVGGGLVGSALAFLVSGDEADDPTLFLSLGALGAAAGFGLMYRTFSDEARTMGQAGGWELDVQPGGLLTLLSGRKEAPRVPTSLFSLRRRF